MVAPIEYCRRGIHIARCRRDPDPVLDSGLEGTIEEEGFVGKVGGAVVRCDEQALDLVLTKPVGVDNLQSFSIITTLGILASSWAATPGGVPSETDNSVIVEALAGAERGGEGLNNATASVDGSANDEN